MQTKPRVYFENLDALRFLCFLSVFMFHSFYTADQNLIDSPLYQFVKFRIFGNGNLAVNFFFVLSGFLITYLLLEERQLFGRIDVPRFWFRRILRIWPLFYVCVFAGFYLFPLLKSLSGGQPNESAHLWSYLTFTNNFDFIKYGTDASVLSVLWSIAVEEQFYLVWPLVVAFTPRGFHWVIFLAILVGSLVFRAVFDKPLIHEYHTLSCIGDMTIGALGALWVVEYKGAIRIADWKRPFLMVIYILVIVVFLFRKELLHHQSFYVRIFERSAIAFLFLSVILEQCFCRGSFFRIGSWKLGSRWGVKTYGLYCLHFWGILVATTLTKMLLLNDHLWQVLFVDTGIALGLTMVIAYLSYCYLEKPFLRMKAKFSSIDTTNAEWKRGI